jgi:hypothetical protein
MMMAEPDIDRLLIEARFPGAEVRGAAQVQAMIVDHPKRVLLQFNDVPEPGDVAGTTLYRVFLEPQQFYGVLEMLLTVGRDLNAELTTTREDDTLG